MEETRNGLTFDQWLSRVNRACVQLSGLSINDLPDFASWDSWASGELPEDAARSVLEDEGFPFDDV